MSELANDSQRYQVEDIYDYFHGAPVGLHITGPEGRIERANLADLELLGYDEHAEEYVGHYLAEFHRDRSLAKNLLEKVAAGEDIQELESELMRRDRKLQRVLIYANARVESGQFRGMRCVTVPHPEDLQPKVAGRSASKDYSSRLGLSEVEQTQLDYELQDFFENAPVGCHIVDGNGLIRHANKLELSLMGYGTSAYINSHVAAFHADREVIDGMLYNLVNGKPLVNTYATVLRENRTKRSVMIYSNSRMRAGSFINSRCVTVTAPSVRVENEGSLQKFSWPRNEELDTAGFTSKSSDEKPDPMTLALRYISSRKRPEEFLGYLARVSQILATKVPLRTSLQNVATLSVPFVADFVSIYGSVGHLAHACVRQLQQISEGTTDRLLVDLRQSGRQLMCIDVESEAAELGEVGAELRSPAKCGG